MPSTYTLNNGIELIGTGEQSGTWGDTTNTNLGLLDVALDGQVTVALASAGSSGSPNSLPISDGTASNGRNRMVVFSDSGDLGATAYVQLTPNDAEKIIYIRNSLSGSRSVILFQGTYNASNDYEVPAGTTAIVYFDGAGAGAVAANVFNNAYFDGLRLGSVSVTAILDEDNMASDSATALATQQSIKAYVDSQVGTVDTLSEILANGNTTGATDIDVDGAQKVQFRDAAIYINSSVDGQLDIVADTEIQIAATTIDVNGALDVSGTALVTGVLTTTAATVSNGGGQFNGAINVGVDDTGYDVKFFGATTGKSLLWDESADSLIVTGTTTLVGTTNLDAVDIDGATQIDATVTVGVDDTGYDVKFFGATAGAYMLWDESADDLILGGAAGLSVNSTALVTGVLTTTAATVSNGGGQFNGAINVGVDDTGYDVKFFGATAGAYMLWDESADDLILGGAAGLSVNSTALVTGVLTTTAATVSNGGGQFNGAINVGVDDTGYDVKFFGDTAGAYMLWDESADDLILGGAAGLSVNSTALVTGVLTTTAATVSNGGGQFNGAINVGVDDTGYDVKFFGDTASAYMLWDASADDLILGGAAGLSVNSTALVTGVLTANGGAVFNEGGADVDFRVESDTNSHMLFVDAGNDRVGVGTGASSPFTTLQVGARTGAGTTNPNTGSVLSVSKDGATGIDLGGNVNAGAVVGAINWVNYYGVGNYNTARIDTYAQGNSNSGELRFWTASIASSPTERMRITSSGGLITTPAAGGDAVFNEDGIDADFRVESDTDTHMLFVDAGANHVGIGTSSPGHPLSIRHSDKADPQIHLETASYGSNYGVKILAASTNEAGTVSSFSNIHKTTASINGRSDVLQHISFVSNTVAADFQKFNCGGTTQLTISGGGSVTVAGALSKGSGSFKIDHPLPAKTETHNLVHSFIEGPQADNIYRGKVTLVDGSATVNIDTVSGMSEGTYVLLNTNTQCFTSNESGWTAVKGSVAGNILTIEAQEFCSDTISWMVVGERHDQHMLDTKWTDENGKVIVEPLKELEL
jgi:hypothetical protein